MVLKCYLNWEDNGRNFNLPPEYISTEWKYKYRDIQKDSLRCFLIYIPIQIVRYLNTLKPDSINKDEVTEFVLTKIKLLRFGNMMLAANDLHNIQNVRNIRMLINHFKVFFDSLGITDDLQTIISSIEDENHRKEDLDESKLSPLAQKICLNT